VQFESLKRMYLAREKLVSISDDKVDVEEIKEKLKTEVEQQNKQLQIMVNSLVTENMDLKGRVQKLEKTDQENSDLKRRISLVEQERALRRFRT
jgi:predicted  nucleic acid-binding Zn-ribbon protein